jgi:hypothetical protein
VVQEVEKQLPGKTEHLVMCKLSRRQRALYEDFLSARSTKESLASGSFMSMMNVLMQLRKVCNHPDLFEGRAILSAYDMSPLRLQVPDIVAEATEAWSDPWAWGRADLAAVGLLPAHFYDSPSFTPAVLQPQGGAASAAAAAAVAAAVAAAAAAGVRPAAIAALQAALVADGAERGAAADAAAERNMRLSAQRCNRGGPLLSAGARTAVTITLLPRDSHLLSPRAALELPAKLLAAVLTCAQRFEQMIDAIVAFTCVIPRARAVSAQMECPSAAHVRSAAAETVGVLAEFRKRCTPLHVALVRQQLYFPDRRLIQYDCGTALHLSIL